MIQRTEITWRLEGVRKLSLTHKSCAFNRLVQGLHRDWEGHTLPMCLRPTQTDSVSTAHPTTKPSWEHSLSPAPSVLTSGISRDPSLQITHCLDTCLLSALHTPPLSLMLLPSLMSCPTALLQEDLFPNHLLTKIFQTILLNGTHPSHFTALLSTLLKYLSVCVFPWKLIETLEQERYCSPLWTKTREHGKYFIVTSWVKGRYTSYFMCIENNVASLCAKFF